MEVEVLTVPNCPNAAPMVAQVRQALDAVGLRDIEVTTRVIVDHEQAKRTAFTGSPTILIDGHDPLAEPGRSTGLACRVYQTANGLAGIPDLERLQQALDTART